MKGGFPHKFSWLENTNSPVPWVMVFWIWFFRMETDLDILPLKSFKHVLVIRDFGFFRAPI